MEDTCPRCGGLLKEETELVGVSLSSCTKCGLLLAEAWLVPGEYVNVSAIIERRNVSLAEG